VDRPKATFFRGYAKDRTASRITDKGVIFGMENRARQESARRTSAFASSRLGAPDGENPPQEPPGGAPAIMEGHRLRLGPCGLRPWRRTALAPYRDPLCRRGSLALTTPCDLDPPSGPHPNANIMNQAKARGRRPEHRRSRDV